MSAKKTVLVSLDDRNRPVTFTGNKQELLKEIKTVFKDLLGDSQVFLQVKDENWGGIFIDVLEQEIPDKSVLKAKRVVVANPEVNVGSVQLEQVCSLIFDW